MKPRRKRDQVAAKHDAEEAEEKIPNPYYLPEGNRTNRHLLRLVRRRMIARLPRHNAERQEGDADVGDEVLESDDDGRDSEGPPVSEASGVEDGAAERAGEEVEIIRDERPTADGVEQLEPGTTDWDVATAEQRLSAAHPAPAAADTGAAAGAGWDWGWESAGVELCSGPGDADVSSARY